MKKLLAIVAGGLIVAILLLTPLGQFVVAVVRIPFDISSSERRVTSKAAYGPAAKALAILCQSDPAFFRDEPPFAPAWTPPEVLQLRPTLVEISPRKARVEFGGGFHHFGYNLELDPSGGDDTHNRWVLSFYSEDSATKTLTSVTLDKSEQLNRPLFIARAVAEFDRRATGRSVSDGEVRERIAFLLKHGETDAARDSIRRCAAGNSRDWLDNLLLYAMDVKATPTASSKLDAWAADHDSFTSWMLAAYSYSDFGDDDRTEQCVRKALAKPTIDSDWLPYNARFLGGAMCVRLYRAQRYESCAALCDALLTYRDNPAFLATPLNKMRDAARGPAPATTIPDPAILLNAGESFNPFDQIDLTRIATSATSPDKP